MIKTFSYDESYIEFSSNSYIVGKNNKPCIVIDLGTTSNDVVNYVKEHHSKCEGIVLTHGHFDHIRGINKFLNSFKGTKIFVHENDLKLLTDPIKNCSITHHGEKVTVNSADIITYKDGDTLKFASCLIKVISTPFHTLGSSCLLVEDDNALFTGDTLFKGSIGRTDLPTSDSGLVPSSLRKLVKLSELLVCYPGHGSHTTLKAEKENNPFFKEILWKNFL